MNRGIPNEIRLSGGVIDLRGCRVLREEGDVTLTHREVALLRYFVANAGRAIPRAELLVEVWGYVEGLRTRATDNAIVRLRNKVEARPEEPVHIHSVRGIGYRFELGQLDDASPSEDSVTGLVGREEEVEQLRTMLRDGRLVTVLGGPGIGKSTVAAHVAGEWQGPVWRAELGSSSQLAELHRALATALGLTLDPGWDDDHAAAALGRSLADQANPLVLLDDFDPLVDVAARSLADWVRTVPQVRFLITCRQRLHLTDERCLALGPLPTTDAMRLFLERARAADPGFRPDSDALRHLVDKLEGVPLALELAASRTRAMSLGEIGSRLERLGHGRRDAPARHRSLEAALSFSWDQLPETDQFVLAQCATFEGAFGLDAAEAVVHSQQPVDLSLSELRDRSLLERTAGARFRMLSIVRRFVRARHPDSGAEARHLRWVLDQVRADVGELSADTAAAARALADGLPEQIAAIRRAADPTLAADLLVLLQENPAMSAIPSVVLELTDRVLTHSLPPSQELQLLTLKATLLCSRRRLNEAADALERAVALDVSEPDLRARLAAAHARLAEGRRDIDTARAQHEWARELYLEAGNQAAAAAALADRARVTFDPARVHDSESEFLQVLDTAKRVGDRRLEARMLGLLGVVAKGRTAYLEADRYFERALEQARRLGDPVLIAIHTIHRGGLVPYLGLTDTTDIEQELAEALDIAAEQGRLNLSAAATGVLLDILIDDERLDEALDVIEALPPDWTDVRPTLRATVWVNIAGVRHLAGETALADQAYDRATQAFADAGQPQYVWRIHCFRALFQAEIGNWARANELFDQAESMVVPVAALPWLEDVRRARTLIHHGNDATEVLDRVERAEALEALGTPIKSSHGWVVRMLRRATS